MLVVAIHDVTPEWLDEVRWLLARLDAAQVRPRVLKVIPAFGGVELDADGELADLLRTEQDRGSEIVVHGFTHRRAGPFRGSPVTLARARLFAREDAEFLSIDRAEAGRRLRRGREILEAAGLRASGFCAPGWLAPGWIDEEARAAGYDYVIGLIRIADLARDRVRFVPTFGYMGSDRLQERLVGMGGDTSIGLHRWLSDRLPDLTGFLHPTGAREAPEAAGTLARIAELSRQLALTTYTDLLHGWHATAQANAGA